MNIPYRPTISATATLLLSICAAATLSGCISAEQQTAEDRQTCSNYGYAQGTNAFANCMMITAQQREKALADWQAEQRREWDEDTAEPAMQECNTTERVYVQGDASMGGETTRTKTKTKTVCIGR